MKKKKENSNQIFEVLFERYPELMVCKQEIWIAYQILLNSYRNGGKLLIAGNGGSHSDSEHMVGELMKSFRFIRKIGQEDEKKLRDWYGNTGGI